MAQASGMSYLAASAIHTYDTDHRLITTRNTDTQEWPGSGTGTQRASWYTYDDLGP
jgi:hypothetical protein